MLSANFTLPDSEDPAFAEVRYVDLNQEEAKDVVALYNKVPNYFEKLFSIYFWFLSFKGSHYESFIY